MDYKTFKTFLEKNKKNIEISSIGKSVLDKDIFVLKKEFNIDFRWALITGGIHAREHLSTDLICLLIEKLIKENPSLNFNLAFVPMINPDGVDFCTNGIKSLDKKSQQNLIKINQSDDFSLYKANANGVDLNNNWDANFEIKHTTKNSPSSQGFYGYASMSEPEVVALANFTNRLNPFITINYHLKGEEIYFDFFQDKKSYCRDLEIAKVFSKSTGYKIISTQDKSSGGFKDWCVQKLKIPALTIELGNDKFFHPFPQSELSSIYEKNKNLYYCLEQSLKIFEKYYR